MIVNSREILPSQQESVITVRAGANIVCAVDASDETDYLIAIVYEEDERIRGIEQRTIEVIKKGEKLPGRERKHIDTVNIDSHLFHVYEVIN